MDTPLGQSRSVAPPLYPSSVYSLPDLDALDAIMDGGAPGFTYARDAHPNAALLATRLAEIEGASWAIMCGSGMGAVSAAILALTSQGDRIVASDRLYGRTTMLFTQELSRLGISTTFVDANDVEAVQTALRTDPKVLFVETISNPLLRVPDLQALAKLARERGCALVVDNTFATPVLCRPLEFGAALVIESLTKLIGGHSDVTLGMLCGRSNDIQQRLRTLVGTWGLSANPFDCWLATRSLATLELRVRQASRNAAALADWLAAQPSVRRVIFPGRTDHPDHDLAKRVLAGFGNMLCFELSGGRQAVNEFFRSARGTPFSPSLGDTVTTLSHPSTTSHRYVEASEKARQGITDGLIRVSVGIEDVEKIKSEISNGLGKLD